MKYLLTIISLPLVFVCIGLFWGHAVVYTIMLTAWRFLWSFKFDATFTSLQRDDLHHGIPYPTVFKTYIHYHIAIQRLPLLTHTNNDTLKIRRIEEPNKRLIEKTLKPLIK